MKNVVIINKKANHAKDMIKHIKKNFDSNDTRVYYIKNPKKLLNIASKVIGEHPQRIIVGGGDGTINSIAHKVARTDIKLGVLPLGTANDFAKTMEIPTDINQSLEIANGESYKKIDLGAVEKNIGQTWSQKRDFNFFLNVATIGIGSKIPLEMNTKLKRLTGALAYRVASVNAFMKFKKFDIKITFLDENKIVEHKNVFHVAIGNGKYYGGGMLVSPHADITNHLFDIYVAEAHSLIDIVKVLRLIKKGELNKANNVFHYQSKRLYIETNTKYPINLDGEIKSHTPAYFAVQENAIDVIVK